MGCFLKTVERYCEKHNIHTQNPERKCSDLGIQMFEITSLIISRALQLLLKATNEGPHGRRSRHAGAHPEGHGRAVGRVTSVIISSDRYFDARSSYETNFYCNSILV